MIKKLWVLGIVSLINNAHADKPALSLVIDDLGYSFEQAKQVLRLPGEHTYAIIPSTTYSQKIARYAHQNGHEIILHMPMQSSVDLVIESTALLDNMSEEEITENVTNMIQEVPHIRGINNHMGSKLTEMDYIMRPVMETIKQQNKNFYFLDSRTTPLSKAYQQALRAGLPSLERDVFLDYDHTNAESIAYQFNRWLKKAKSKGHAVAIAHPYQSTLTLLKQKIEETISEFDYMKASQLIELTHKENNPWPKYLSHWQQDSKN